MKTLLCIIMVLAFSGLAFATDLARVPYPIISGPNSPNAIQEFAPDGTSTTALTVASTTVNLGDYIRYQLESGSGTTCYVRQMPTSAKGAYGRVLLRTAGTMYTRAKNLASPFVNFSGCTGGSYTLQ